MDDTGQRLRHLRLKRKLKRYELAAILDFCPSTIAYHERGDRGTSHRALDKYLKFYGLTRKQFYAMRPTLQKKRARAA